MPRATRSEIATYVAAVPNAHETWVDVLYSAGLPMAAVDKFVQTMALDAGSPLRKAEDSELSKEIVKLNGVFGDLRGGERGNGCPVVKINAVLTASEISRVVAVVGNFCQPSIRQNGRFGRNGHAVMNAVRRSVTGYMFSRVPYGCSVVEVGPDVKHWIVDVSTREWSSEVKGKYVGARPVKNQRDVVRVGWEVMAARVLRDKHGLYDEKVVDRVNALVDSYDEIFPCKDIQDIQARGDYIVSVDSNYDIKFADMPGVLVSCGARAWLGCMLRIKGVTSYTKLNSGSLEMTGATYRVDWRSGRVDFRHPQCNAFGYSHDVNELVKYEELNGYVWTSGRANYVYAKGPETNDELLFFSVVRVPKAIYMLQPNFVENPHAGMVELESVWAVGDWESGLPQRFEPIRFCVDALAFGKVFEKRRAIDTKGDIAQTLVLVRSTNVRMWLNGTPVGVDRRISASLAEAVAVAVEVIVSQLRHNDALVFETAMRQYKINVTRGGWLYRLFESVVDLRGVCGSITRPFSQAWGSLRGVTADMALSSISQVKVSHRLVGDHVAMGTTGSFNYIGVGDGFDDTCKCKSVSYARVALAVPGISGDERKFLERKLSEGCSCAIADVDGWICSLPDLESAVSGESSVDDSSSESVIAGGCSSDSSVSDSTELTVVSERDMPRGWRKIVHEDRVERKSMMELVELELYLLNARKTEVRIDAGRIVRAMCKSTGDVLRECTSRTQHLLVRVLGGKVVEKMGYDIPEFGAVYDHKSDAFFPVTTRGSVGLVRAHDGWYYTCNHLRVWNTEEIVSAVEYALDYGVVRDCRSTMEVLLGVPGAGKTYSMMKRLAEEFPRTGVKFLVLAVTSKSKDAAIAEGLRFGLNGKLLEARVLTLDSYLINHKFPAELVCVDEFPMTHIGKVDAAISISGAHKVRLCGDGRQIPYDPFTAEFPLSYSTLSATCDARQVVFEPETHRLSEDVCAAFLDMYPTIYPCECCRKGEKDKPTMRFVPIAGLHSMTFRDDVRYHAYKRAERDEIIDGFRMERDDRKLKMGVNKGIGTVHEDQGSTHKRVVTVRLHADFDKNASSRNPSLHNRPNYVLTDMTRHTHEYEYNSTSAEVDLVRKRIALGSDQMRLELVRKKEGMGLTTLMDMLENRFDSRIAV